MLDLMRRKSRLKWLLWLVIISLGLGMLLFFVPGANMGGNVESHVALVGDEEISIRDFVNTYQNFVNRYTQERTGSIPKC